MSMLYLYTYNCIQCMISDDAREPHDHDDLLGIRGVKGEGNICHSIKKNAVPL